MSDLLENHVSGLERVAIEDSPAAPSITGAAEAPTDVPEEYEDMQALMAGEAGGFRTLRRHQILKGTVVSVDAESVLVHIGTKSEGIIPRDELAEEGEDPPELRYEQEIFVHVLEPDSPRGPILSLKRARREQSWVDMEEYARSGETISAMVVDHNRGGALLDARGLRGFLPLSQLVSLGPSTQSPEEGDDTPERLAQLHGQRLTVKVLEADRNQNRLILSERAAADELKAQKRTELLADLKPGQIRHGQVRNVTNFGAFIDLGGADGLVHVSELSYERVQDPRRILQPGQEVDVYVMDVRPDDQKISLSLKRATADPWESVAERYQPGQVVEALITRLMKFGAFAQVEPGVEGLIHVTELADNTPKDPGQVVQSGQQVQTKIIHIDQPGHRLGLSLRQVRPADAVAEMTPDQWHEEQERQSIPRASAFDALSSLADTLGKAEAEPAKSSSSVTSEVDQADSRIESPVDNVGEKSLHATSAREGSAEAIASEVLHANKKRAGAPRRSRDAVQTPSEESPENEDAEPAGPTAEADATDEAEELGGMPGGEAHLVAGTEQSTKETAAEARTKLKALAEPGVQDSAGSEDRASVLTEGEPDAAKKRVRTRKKSDKPDSKSIAATPPENAELVAGTSAEREAGRDDASESQDTSPVAGARASDKRPPDQTEINAQPDDLPEAVDAVRQSV